MFYIVVLLFSGFVECINNAINKTTRQQNNQATLTYFYLLIFYYYLLMFYPICLVYTFTNYSSKICLEDNTERSESNPGRSLGTTTKKKRAV